MEITHLSYDVVVIGSGGAGGAAAQANISSESQWNQSFIDYIELINMVDTAEPVTRSALERKSSLGAHVRLDSTTKIFPFSKPHSIAIFVETGSNYKTYTINRPATSWRRLLPHFIRARKREVGMKTLRILPSPLRDWIVERLFKSVMGEITRPNTAQQTASASHTPTMFPSEIRR